MDRLPGTRRKNHTSDQSPSHVWLKQLLAIVLLLLLVAPFEVAQGVADRSEVYATRQVRKALAQAKTGDIDGATTIADRLLSYNPRYVPAIKLKAMLMEKSGKQADAAEEYELGLRLAPDDPDLLLKAGIYRLAGHKVKDAVSVLSRCAGLLPKDGDTQYYLAQAYHLDGQDKLALAAIARAVKLEPDAPVIQQKYGELLSHTGQYTAAVAQLTKARASDASLLRIDYDIGLAQYNLMDFADAVDALRRETGAHPDDADAWALLATTHLRLNHWQKSKDAFTRFLALHPEDVESLLAVGHCEVELHDNDAAIQTLKHVLSLDPRLLNAHFYLSRAYAATGDMNAAQREAALHHLMMEKVTFVRSAETEQRESEIAPKVRRLLEVHREEEALVLYRKQFQQATEADAYAFIGKTYAYMGDTEAGVKKLHRALALSPAVRDAHTTLGILALSQGDFENAEREFQAELQNDPNAQDAIAELGEVRYRQKRWAEAAAFLEKSKTMTPELLFMLTDTYFQLGKVNDARLNAELVAAYGRGNKQIMGDLIALLERNGQLDTAQRIQEEVN